MQPDINARIRSNPKFSELVAKRSAFGWMLSIIMLVIYYAFIVVIAFWPQKLGTPLGDGVMTVGFPLGVAVIVSAVAITGIYVWRANSEFDQLTKEIIEEAK